MTLTLGKIRGLDALAADNGTFAILAMDHRNSFRRMVSGVLPEATWDDVAAEKIRLVSALAPEVTAALFDPIFTAAPVLKAGALPGSHGFLVSRERSGYEETPEGRVAVMEAGWSVEAIRRLGAAGVKLLIHYHPGVGAAARQQEVVAEVAEACRVHDIALIVEPVAYRPDGGEMSDPAFQAEMPDIVVETARALMPLGGDLLKAEFPAPGATDEAGMRSACRRLSDAVPQPWVVLSGGVAFDLFERQLSAAAAEGASGFLAGRSVWKDAMTITDPAARDAFLAGTARPRMARLRAIAETATPWRARPVAEGMPALAEGWHKAYAGG